MLELGRIKSLIRVLNEPANTMQECDRKRVAILQLGDLGDESAVHPLLGFINENIYSITAIAAIGKLRYVNSKEGDILFIVDKLAEKVENGSYYESINAIDALKKIAQQKIDSSEVVGRVLFIMKNNGNNNSDLRCSVIKKLKELKDTKEFHKPKQGKTVTERKKARY